jgi:hypothetical protein
MRNMRFEDIEPLRAGTHACPPLLRGHLVALSVLPR